MTGFELEILRSIQSIKCGFLDAVMPAISSLCNWGALWIAAAVVLLCFKKTRRWGVTLAVALILCGLLNNIILKNLIARERPFVVDPTIKLIIETPREYSFPSGHALTSFAAATVLMYYDRKYLGIAALVTAALIAFSRLYLQVHFLTDVLGGALLGAAFAFAAIGITEKLIPRIRRRREKRGGEQNEKEN